MIWIHFQAWKNFPRSGQDEKSLKLIEIFWKKKFRFRKKKNDIEIGTCFWFLIPKPDFGRALFNTELGKWEWHQNCAHAFLSMKHPKLSQLKMFLWEYSDFCYKQLSSVSLLFFNCGIQEAIRHFLMWKLVLQQKSKDFQCK